MVQTPARSTRYPGDALGGLQRLSSALEQAFAWPFMEQGGFMAGGWLPACDVMEEKDGLRIMAEVPGVRPEDIQVNVENNVLTIRGEKRLEHEETDEGGRGRRTERSYGMFERAFVLPHSVDAERIEATVDHGVLTVRLPTAEQARPRRIEVKSQAGGASAIGSGAEGAPGGRQGRGGQPQGREAREPSGQR